MSEIKGTILLLGAAGFIGQHIAFALRDAGYRVLASARNTRRLEAMGFKTLQADLTDPKTHSPDFWRSQLTTCTHVINCAGLLTGSDAAFRAVHVTAPRAVYAAMPDKAQIILISAIGTEANTPFAHYRRLGEEAANEAPIPAFCCWAPVVHLQIKIRDMAQTALTTSTPLPTKARKYFRIWFTLGWPAFIALTAVFWLMVNRPDLPFFFF